MTVSEAIIAQLTPDEAARRKEALEADVQDPLRHFRDEFIFPTVEDLHSKTLERAGRSEAEETSCLYLCGNSLGLQPKLLKQRVDEHLTTWARRGVTGHFVKNEDAALAPWVDADDQPTRILADIVGAAGPDEVAAMETLTANLHLALASFYQPTAERWKIIVEGKAFPSDHYAVESQLRHHGYSPRDGLVTIDPEDGKKILTTERIIAIIDENASSSALLLLPGIQYYTGQLFDIPTITKYAHERGLVVGWDLAHAAGNVPLQLHDWEVDFAVWCNYKYVNGGPGAIAGLFVHRRHGSVDLTALDRGDLDAAYRPRLAGWWGYDKGTRFNMNTVPGPTAATAFIPRPGAAGFQVGNPNDLGLAALQGTLDVFAQTSMSALREKSLKTTAFLERALDWHAEHFWNDDNDNDGDNDKVATNSAANGTVKRSKRDGPPYWIISPRDPAWRGAQLSIQLPVGLLEGIMAGLDRHGVVVDERKPDVVRVAPAPLYNSFADCWTFAYIFAELCKAELRPGYRARLDNVPRV